VTTPPDGDIWNPSLLAGYQTGYGSIAMLDHTTTGLQPVFGTSPQLGRMLTRIGADNPLLRVLDSYYRGAQPLSFLAPEIQRAVSNRLKSLVVNWPRLVVNSLEERLDVDGFRQASDQPADAELWRIWQANDLDEQSQMCHTDALIHGRAYAIVWADPDDPKTPRVTVESAEQMTVDFEPGTTNVVAAVKHWSQEDMLYATVYLPDTIERYQVSSAAFDAAPSAAEAPWQFREDPIRHDLGVVPVVPFINRPRMTHLYGESELIDVLPLADAVNKLATDMMVSAEYHAMPRRWATGIDLGDTEGDQAKTREAAKQMWTQAEAGRVWMSDSKDAQFGQFTEAKLDNFVRGIEMLAAQIAAIAGLPPHYVGLMSQANPASADAIRSAEASLVKRAQRKQRVFGGCWERVMRLVLLVRDGAVPAASRSMETIWRDPNTSTWAQQVDAAVKLDGIGLPLRQNLEMLSQTPTQIERVFTTRNEDAMANVAAQLEAADAIVEKFGFSRAAALAAVGLEAAGKVEATVEARAPGPGVVNDAELAAEVAAETPVVAPVAPAAPAAPAAALVTPPKAPTAPAP
jgi:hypothetical protein